MIRKEYVSFSAGALVVGAVSLVLGFALNPLPQDEPISAANLRPGDMSEQWLMSSIALFVSAVGLTLGVASLMSLMRPRDTVLRVLVPIVLSVGTVGMAGYATGMIFMRALVLQGHLQAADIEMATTEAGVQAIGATIVVGFVLGTVLVAWGLLRARTTPRWVPAVLLAFVASQFVPVPGNAFTVAQFVALAVAMTGAAVSANDHAQARDELVLTNSQFESVRRVVRQW